MKILSGILKGKSLAFKKKTIRPTSDKVKEALFNIVANKIQDSLFLDVFSGTGAIGIEAFSRGAKEVCFIDIDGSLLFKNINNLEIKNTKFYKAYADKAIKLLAKKKILFDIIYLDPPYDYKFYDKLLLLVANANILKEDGLIILEHHKKQTIKENYQQLSLYKVSKYGETYLSFFNSTIKLVPSPKTLET